jgi:endonuclease YncB( thermonuclease family)
VAQIREYPAWVEKVYDGDTLTVFVDLGFDTWRHTDVRLVVTGKLGINAIELKDPGGKEARAELLRLAPLGSSVQVTSYGWDKYGGRIDAAIILADGRNLGEELVRAGWAAQWDGKGARPLPNWPR